ncbi:hypothetical protein [Pelobacter seleniigenes]|uniref:hypothetical protein n=1 Tax=Pelobacter seleniigenes TaxID=407188 RepID=UPI0012B9535A|nr:hypothetical protein [Pelobacter seleniigenes]
MLTFRIHGENAVASLYLWELVIQCQVAEYAYKRLKEQSRIDIERDFNSTWPHSQTAVEIFADCSAFLSATSIVSKIIFSGIDTNKPKGTNGSTENFHSKRSCALRKLLKIDNLPTLHSLGVRNSFEHIDERLDRLFREQPSGDFTWIHLTRHEPPTGLVLKRFDPNQMKICYLDQELDIATCFKELEIVKSKANASHRLIRKYEPLIDLLSCSSKG